MLSSLFSRTAPSQASPPKEDLYSDLLSAVHASAYSLAEPGEPKKKIAELRKRVTDTLSPHEERIDELANQFANSDGADSERFEKDMDAAGQAREDALGRVMNEITVDGLGAALAASRHLVGRTVDVLGEETPWEMDPYDEQIQGALALLAGNVVEMATGEGKTLAAALALSVAALPGRGTHLVTVNSYLARRDAAWMGALYDELGLTVGCVDGTAPASPERKAAYRTDITYGTTSEFGFDYLRDHMTDSAESVVQRGHWFAIVDEADSVLIDESQTPLIIAGVTEEDYGDVGRVFQTVQPEVKALFGEQTAIVSSLVSEAEQALEEEDLLKAGDLLAVARQGLPRHRRLVKLISQRPEIRDLIEQAVMRAERMRNLEGLEKPLLFGIDEEEFAVRLTDKGGNFLSQEGASPYDLDDPSSLTDEELTARSSRVHALHQMLKAYALMNRDEEYVVEDGEVKIVDASTGRTMEGRRWSNGLHQAIEAKEGVAVSKQTQNLASTTIQNYFRMYSRLAGMTGTALSAASELESVYKLNVIAIPTHEPIRREDKPDLIFRTRVDKLVAAVTEIARLHRMDLPVLVGTGSVEASETVSRMLRRVGVPHEVLNAKAHEKEAGIVAHAGNPGAVTVSTNMAGRGTDIRLGEGVTAPRTVGWIRRHGLDVEECLPEFHDVQDIDSLGEDFVVETGGLHVIGTERHESRRIDRQLRGRAGRQGDPGVSVFYVSFEDPLLRMFASERVGRFLSALQNTQGRPLTGAWTQKVVDKAQHKVDQARFEARKRIVAYDEALDKQRRIVYELRDVALMADGVLGEILSFAREVDPSTLPKIQEIMEVVGDEAEEALARALFLSLDARWREHLRTMDHIKSGIHWRGYGMMSPIAEFKRETIEMFEGFWEDVLADLIRRMDAAIALAREEGTLPQPAT